MATYEESLAVFHKEMEDIGFHHHDDLYHAICKHLGPSIYDADGSKVACSDPKELATIKKNFLMGELGMTDEEKMDAAIEQACQGLGESNRHKHRSTFYYLLVAILNKEDHFIEHK